MAGKTLLARALPGILPEMSPEESLDVTRIYSVIDQLPTGRPLIRHRPFRSPHHTISHAGLVGGVLFLDEFPNSARAAMCNLKSCLRLGSKSVRKMAWMLLWS